MNEGLSPNPEPEMKPVERAVVLLKPGYLDHSGRLIGYLEKKGLAILDQQTITFDKETARTFYPHAESSINKRLGPEEGKAEMGRFVGYITSGETMALLVGGENAIQITNRLRDKVRSWFKLQRPDDAIHTSSDQEEAEREAAALGLSDIG